MSYRITIDGEPFCSSNFDHSQILDPKVTLEANKAGSLTFTMLPDHPYYEGIAFRQSLFDVYLNDELIFEGIPVDEATDFYDRKTITCEGELTFLNDTIQRQAVYQNKTVAGLLGEYLTVHNAQADASKQFSLGSVTVDGGNSLYRYTNYESTMKELQEDLIENFGGFFRVRHSGGTRYLDYLDASPHNSSQTIRIGKNLVDLSQNLSSLDICTVLIPLGAKTETQLIEGLEARLTIADVNSGLDYLVGTAQAYYGNVWKTKIWDDVTTAAALKSKGQDYLDDAQWANLVIQATAFDLGLATEDVEQFHVLDMIRVISEPHGLDRYFLLSKLNIDLDHPANTQITLGQDTRLTLSARTAQVSAEVERQPTQIMVNASNNARQILDSATYGAIQILYNSDGVAYELRINNSQNPATATKWWRYNSGGWGFTADGGQTYTAAATNDGTIFATLIKAGILSSDNGKFYVNLDTGAATLSDVTLDGGSINLGNGVFAVDSSGNLTAKKLSSGNTTIMDGKVSIGDESGYGNLYLINGNNSLNLSSYGLVSNDAALQLDNSKLRLDLTEYGKTLLKLVGGEAEFRARISSGGSTQTPIRAKIDSNGVFHKYSSNGNQSVAQLTTTSSGYGSLVLKDDYSNSGYTYTPVTRVILNDGGLYFYDHNSTLRCRLNPTGGLNFYNSSGTLTKSYPAT